MIATYLKRTSASAFAYGRCDCVLWPAGLVLEATGTDPALRFRGQYDSFFSYRQLLIENGGMVRLCDEMMKVFPSGEAENGVGLVRLQSGHYVGCILCSGRVIMKTRRGVVSPGKFNLVRGWSLCRK